MTTKNKKTETKATEKKRIEALTPEQMAQTPQYVECWLKIGLSCEPVNFEEAIEAAKLCYKLGNEKAPEVFLLAGGPLSGAVVAQLLMWEEEGGPNAKESGPTGFGIMEPEMQASISRVMTEAHKKGMIPWKPTLKEIEARTKRITQSLVQARLSEMTYGYHWASWSAFVMYYREVVGLIEETEDALGHVAISQKCGWWAPYDTVCILQERHSVLHLDDRGDLHAEKAPAVRYPDGFEVYAHHGTVVEKRLIMEPESITLKEIADAKNVEVRRVLRTLYGEGRYLKDIGAKLIDADFEGCGKGAAPRALLQDNENQKFLVGTDGSTGRVYYMLCPSEVRTCREAHMALAGFDEGLIVAKS